MSTGPAAAAAPGPGAAVRRVTFRITLAEPLTEPLHDAAGVVFDTELAKSARAVLIDNGYPVDALELEPAAGPSSGTAPGMVEGWPLHARQLDMLLAEVASARRRAAVAYAESYLAAEGTQQARAATAELAAAAAREELETLEGRAEAFRMVLAAESRTDALAATVIHAAAGQITGGRP